MVRAGTGTVLADSHVSRDTGAPTPSPIVSHVLDDTVTQSFTVGRIVRRRLQLPSLTTTVVISSFNPFDTHCCHMGTAIKHPMPDQVKPSFVIFNIRAL